MKAVDCINHSPLYELLAVNITDTLV